MSWVALARKDVTAEIRGRETLVPLLLVALLVGAVGLLALHDVEDRATVASAVIWTALAFASALGLARSFGSERDRGTLDTLLSLPIDRSAMFFGKAAANLALLLATAAAIVPIYAVGSGDGLSARQLAALAGFVILGAVGLAATGTMLSALAARARSRDLMLPVLLFPLLVPLLIAAVHGTQDALRGEPFSEWRPELTLLVGYDLAFAAAGALLFEQAVDA